MQKIIKISLSLLLLFSWISTSLAVGNVYIQNNTGLTLDLQISQYGDNQLDKGDEWGVNTTQLIPWQKKKKALWYNRDSGITWGKSFYFDTRITINNQYITTLQQKLKGTWRFSNLYHSIEGSDFSQGWSQGYDILEESFSVNGKQYQIKYSADYNGSTSSDDIIYALHEVTPYSLPSGASNQSLKVLSYNLYTILTNSASDINRRMQALPEAITGYDVIVFEEAFYNSAREDLINNIASEYPYQTDILDTSGYLEDGGVFIASKWPIELEGQFKYDNCSGVDCLSPKGAVYAKINKQGVPYHVFGSHLQAENSNSAKAARLAQFQELKSYIDLKNISANEAVIIAGDMNVDKLSSNQEYLDMLQMLNASEPAIASYSHEYSDDDATNNMASEQSWLDYVLYSNEHSQPTQSSEAVLVLKSNDDDMFDVWDYSDHYSVFGYFEFN